MIDTHCHIIPNIDDGSRDEECSLRQLLEMDSGGISHAYLTSHYFKGHYEYSREEYLAKLESLQRAVTAAGAKIKLLPGFEIFLQPNILQDVQAKNLCLGDSKYILIESELNGLPPDFHINVYPLLRAGYRPILAHAERYVSIMKHPLEAQSLVERNLYLQVNSGSLLGQYGEKVKETAWLLIKYGWAHVLGSDDHTRGPYQSYFDALDAIEAEIDAHTVKLLTETHPAMILEDKIIPYRYVYVDFPSHLSRHKRPHKSRSRWHKLFGKR